MCIRDRQEYLKLLLVNLGYLFSFLFLFGSNIILAPVQASINNWYYKDAKKIIEGMPNLTIIGITGSYGKTSTKHYLHRILSEKYNVLMTPGSYNTLMGVIITIRRDLKPYHNVFIVEMGAKQNGDIKEICDLVNPKYGILTAVGGQHLETFKTIENVQKTKFELVDALPSDGLAILNSDFPYVANRPITNVDFKYYGLKEEDVAITAKDISYDHEGMQFKVYENLPVEKAGELVSLQTKILGDYNVSNLLACVLMAKELGVEYSVMHYGAKRIQPVKHRLEMKKSPNNVTILDDAFNSNPLGAKMALDVMNRFDGGKKIIITPGMVELGTEQEALNQTFGEQISEVCDYVVLVGEKQTKPILAGLKNKNFSEEKIFVVKSFDDGIKRLHGIVTAGDVVLYENCLLYTSPSPRDATLSRMPSSA